MSEDAGPKTGPDAGLVSRRQVLRRGLVAAGGGAALLWARPAVASVNLAQAPVGSEFVDVGGGGIRLGNQNGNQNGNLNGNQNGGGGVSVLGVRLGRGAGALPVTGLSPAQILAAGLGAAAAGGGAASYEKVRKNRKARKIRKARETARAAAAAIDETDPDSGDE